MQVKYGVEVCSVVSVLTAIQRERDWSCEEQGSTPGLAGWEGVGGVQEASPGSLPWGGSHSCFVFAWFLYSLRYRCPPKAWWDRRQGVVKLIG